MWIYWVYCELTSMGACGLESPLAGATHLHHSVTFRHPHKTTLSNMVLYSTRTYLLSVWILDLLSE